MPLFMRPYNQQHRTAPDRTQTGFSLIEVMIAIGIFSIGLLAINYMLTTITRGNATASNVNSATAWAKTQAEEITTWDYSDSRLNNDEADPEDIYGPLPTNLSPESTTPPRENSSTGTENLHNIKVYIFDGELINGEVKTKVIRLFINNTGTPLREDFELLLIKSVNN